MVNIINESAITVVDSWKSMIETQGGTADLKIDQYMRSFSGDVISKACFGSNYSKGEEIFLKLRLLQEALSKKGIGIAGQLPAMRYKLHFYQIHSKWQRCTSMGMVRV